MDILKVICERFGDGARNDGTVLKLTSVSDVYVNPRSSTLTIYLPSWMFGKDSLIGTVILTDCLTENSSHYVKSATKLKAKKKID